MGGILGSEMILFFFFFPTTHPPVMENKLAEIFPTEKTSLFFEPVAAAPF